MTSANLVPSDTVEPALQNIWILLNKIKNYKNKVNRKINVSKVLFLPIKWG